MGDIFGKKVDPYKKNLSADAVLEYTEKYHRIVRDYKTEIQFIEDMMIQLRKERETFYLEKLPEIKKTIIQDEVSEEICSQWISEIQANMEKSFSISEKLIQNYITDNLEEFREKLKRAMEEK